ncbi:hypothetical protein ACOT81_38305 [Streptomyces sp. WI04-05B]|uniref:hypothetical protein n=1 Tax=Streptomyces TaxID=1883 RepID=UPI0029A4DC9F|nr:MULTISPECIES: hypothetical protein [unclassified Streptomyces]MDX2545917.1 hypothetical protein [Streptomyces sp. WI04-05B]MDX2586476.1 hypothetical protein [Streptomyces sp. WI04-05A]
MFDDNDEEETSELNDRPVCLTKDLATVHFVPRMSGGPDWADPGTPRPTQTPPEDADGGRRTVTEEEKQDEQEDLSLTPEELVKFLWWVDESCGPEEVLEFISSEPTYVASFIRSYKNLKA